MVVFVLPWAAEQSSKMQNYAVDDFQNLDLYLHIVTVSLGIV